MPKTVPEKKIKRSCESPITMGEGEGSSIVG